MQSLIVHKMGVSYYLIIPHFYCLSTGRYRRKENQLGPPQVRATSASTLRNCMWSCHFFPLQFPMLSRMVKVTGAAVPNRRCIAKESCPCCPAVCHAVFKWQGPVRMLKSSLPHVSAAQLNCNHNCSIKAQFVLCVFYAHDYEQIDSFFCCSLQAA